MALEMTSVAVTIVDLLKQRGSLPFGYLAKLVSRRPSEIKDDVEELRKKHIIQIEERGDEWWVSLSRNRPE